MCIQFFISFLVVSNALLGSKATAVGKHGFLIDVSIIFLPHKSNFGTVSHPVVHCIFQNFGSDLDTKILFLLSYSNCFPWCWQMWHTGDETSSFIYALLLPKLWVRSVAAESLRKSQQQKQKQILSGPPKARFIGSRVRMLEECCVPLVRIWLLG